MGYYRFKLSELIPNAWFHKLRDMNRKSSKPSTTTTSRTPCRPPSPPTKPPRNRLPHRPTVDSKSSTTSADSAASGTASFSPDFRSDQLLLPHHLLTTTSCESKLSKSSTIITKPAATARKTAVSSPAGVKLRMRSPRISTRKSVSSGGRRSGSSTRRSRAVMKASVDPRRDFKESMEEMIAENNIRASKDLEELLACYLCLNSEEYHSIIINVFKQIWLDLNFPLPHSK